MVGFKVLTGVYIVKVNIDKETLQGQIVKE